MRRWFCCSQFRASYREHEHEFPSSLDEKEGNGFDTKSDPTKAPPPIEIPELSLDELKEKTDNFGSKALIGEGSYGRVYHAILDSRKHLAVKKLDTSVDPEPDNEFLCNIDETYLNFCVKWVDGVLVFNFCFDFVKLAICG